jgi:hypothetical protein
VASVAEAPEQAAYDAATSAILAALDRLPGLQRAVLAQLTPAEQQLVFAADDRHRDRTAVPEPARCTGCGAQLPENAGCQVAGCELGGDQ